MLLEWANIKSATQNFSHNCFLGENSYKSTYKAIFKDSITMAMKQSTNYMPNEDLRIDFLTLYLNFSKYYLFSVDCYIYAF